MSRADNPFDTYLLRVFAMLMAERSVSRAASRLNQSQPAVSAALKRLRDIFGDPLLIKDKQAVKTKAQSDEESAQELSPLERMAADFEDALDQVLQLMALWMRLPDAGHVSVRGNFDADYMRVLCPDMAREAAACEMMSAEVVGRVLRRSGLICTSNTSGLLQA